MIFASLLPSNDPLARLDDLKQFRMGLFWYFEHGDVRGEWDSYEGKWKRARGGLDTEDILIALLYQANGVTYDHLLEKSIERNDTPEIIAQREADVIKANARREHEAKEKERKAKERIEKLAATEAAKLHRT